jgi:hypothetical protein
LWPEDIDDALVSNVTAVVFTAVTVASMVRFRMFRRGLDYIVGYLRPLIIRDYQDLSVSHVSGTFP